MACLAVSSNTNAQSVPLSEARGAGAALERALVLATCTAVTFLYAMTVTIANVSLPQMQGALSATPDQIAWVVTSNIVATAVMTPLAGWLTSRFGRRRLCNACVLQQYFVDLARRNLLSAAVHDLLEPPRNE